MDSNTIDWTKPIYDPENMLEEPIVTHITSTGAAVVYFKVKGRECADVCEIATTRLRNIRTLAERCKDELASLEDGSLVRLWGREVAKCYKGFAAPLIKRGLGYQVAFVGTDKECWSLFEENGTRVSGAYITPAHWTLEEAAQLAKELGL